MKTDAQVIDICRHFLFIEHEEARLVERDPYAPEEGTPNHARHQALLAERAALGYALSKATPPKTLKGIRALAEVAMTLIDVQRIPATNLFAPEDFVEWVTLSALTSAAGRREAIPLPEYLSNYWPAEPLR